MRSCSPISRTARRRRATAPIDFLGCDPSASRTCDALHTLPAGERYPG
jgi:hypothetical protein